MRNHNEFITTSITYILDEMIFAITPITNVNGISIESYPIFEYIMQMSFIKMCGFQEQKLKCILWELANNNYDFRYEYLSNHNNSYPNSGSACSSYKDKNQVYQLLVKQIKDVIPKFNVTDHFDKKTPINNKKLRKNLITPNKIEQQLKDCSFYYFYGEKQKEFISIYKETFKINQFGNDDRTLLNSQLKEIYDVLYANRNHIAHNTKSFQHNLPSLNSLRDENYKYENYFVWFALLVLIDDIFIELYKKYLETLDQRKFL